VIAAGVPFEEIDESHLLALIENGFSERRTVEYKRDLPGGKDDDKKEFLADVSSLANASGGDLLFGIDAADGVPTRLAPLKISPDAVKLAWESSIRGGIDPRIPGIQVREIAVAGGHVLLFRIPRSWAGPHAVTYKKTFRFHSRTSAGKYSLDVGELRSAFLGGNAIAEQIRSFRAERLGQIIAGETPVALLANPKVIVHVIPYEAFAGRPNFELTTNDGSGLFRPLFRSYSGSTRWNIDGVLTFAGMKNEDTAEAYSQLFRNGIYEGVDAGMIRGEIHDQYKVPYLYGQWLEYGLNGELANSLEALRRLGVQTPMAILVTVVGVNGYVMLAGENYFGQSGHTFDRDMLLLPDVVLDGPITDYRDELPRLMRPIVDAFWQAAGWAGSPSYDAEGKWTDPR
jgi:hypothetical protein